MDVLRADAISEQTPWNAPQERPLQHFHEQWCSRPLAFVRERRPDEIVLHDNLQAAGYARWKFAALLDLFECVDRYCAAPLVLGENTGRWTRIPHRPLDTDPAD